MADTAERFGDFTTQAQRHAFNEYFIKPVLAECQRYNEEYEQRSKEDTK